MNRVAMSSGTRCSGCSNPICDPYCLYTDNRFFHMQCLRCSICNNILNNERSMFLKRGQILCRDDYLRTSSGSCNGCGQMIPADCMALKIPCKAMALNPSPAWLSYHPGCLRCLHCNQSMATGDRYLLRQDKGGVVCLNGDCATECHLLQTNQMLLTNGPAMPTVPATNGGRKRGRQSNAVKVKVEKMNQY